MKKEKKKSTGGLIENIGERRNSFSCLYGIGIKDNFFGELDESILLIEL